MDENTLEENFTHYSSSYQDVFPSSAFDLLWLAFNVLESSVERVSDARVKIGVELVYDQVVDFIDLYKMFKFSFFNSMVKTYTTINSM